MGKPAGLATVQRRALARLKGVPGLELFYLAGGGAIAARLHHRRSNDLDLFSLRATVNLDEVLARLQDEIERIELLSISDAVLRIRTGGVAIDLVRYSYPLLERPRPGPESFPTAGLRDLAAMKLAAIARRGLRRDFWDLHAMAEHGMTLRRVERAAIAAIQRTDSAIRGAASAESQARAGCVVALAG